MEIEYVFYITYRFMVRIPYITEDSWQLHNACRQEMSHFLRKSCGAFFCCCDGKCWCLSVYLRRQMLIVQSNIEWPKRGDWISAWSSAAYIFCFRNRMRGETSVKVKAKFKRHAAWYATIRVIQSTINVADLAIVIDHRWVTSLRQ